MKELYQKIVITSYRQYSDKKDFYKSIPENLVVLKYNCLNLNFVKELIKYEGFEFITKKTKKKELNKLSYSKALELVFNSQSKYLTLPLFIIYDNFYNIIHIEKGEKELRDRYF